MTLSYTAYPKKFIPVLFYLLVVGGIPCQSCGKILSSKRSVRQHESVVHLNTAPYKCCNTNFRSSSHLSRHRCNVHGTEKKFECSKCHNTPASNLGYLAPPLPPRTIFMGAKLFIGTPWKGNEGVLKKNLVWAM